MRRALDSGAVAAVAVAVSAGTTTGSAQAAPAAPASPATLAANGAAALVAARPAQLHTTPAERFAGRVVTSKEGLQYVPYQRTFEAGPTSWTGTTGAIGQWGSQGQPARTGDVLGLARRLRHHAHRGDPAVGHDPGRLHGVHAVLPPAHRQRGDHHDGPVRQADRHGRRDDAGHVLQPEQGERLRAAVLRRRLLRRPDSSLQTSFVIDDTGLTAS